MTRIAWNTPARCAVLLFALTILLCGCTNDPSSPNAAAATPSTRPAIGSWGVDLKGMDRNVGPGDDFFMFVNGGWYKAAEIPADRASIGTFPELRILSENRMIEISDGLRGAPLNQLAGDERKLRDLYEGFLDQQQIDSRGLEAARQDLDYLRNVKTLDDVASAMSLPGLDSYRLFSMYFDLDDRDSSKYAVYVSHSGLGMPNRDYYLGDAKELEQTRNAYKKYLAGMFTIAGMDEVDARAARVYDLEYRIAQAQWSNAERRDAEKTFNPMTVSQLKQFAPQFPWEGYFEGAGISAVAPAGARQFIVREKSAFPKLAAIFKTTPVSVWRDYLIVHYLHRHAAYLPSSVDSADFAFYGTVLQGNAKQLDRKIRATRFLDETMGEALGRLYVAKYFPPESKAKAEDLVKNLLKAYESDIQTLQWMTPETRGKALDKLHRFGVKIGYPDQWRDYTAYNVDRDDLLGNVRRSAEFDWNRQLKRLDGPVDRSEWGMTPQTVNAYNYFELNEIVFPAAILQPPFFDPNADDAVNYGGIGAVIGHEISHGFDDQGSKFDASGSLNNWWTAEDRKKFDSRAAALGKQFDSYEPLPGLHVNGAATMGENIADLAGVSIAFKAYQIALGGKPARVLDSFTGEQRFYMSYAQIWRAKYRDGSLRQQVLSDPHSPSAFRVIGTIRNQDSWYAAFNVQSDDKYYLPPEQRVRLW